MSGWQMFSRLGLLALAGITVFALIVGAGIRPDGQNLFLFYVSAAFGFACGAILFFKMP